MSPPRPGRPRSQQAHDAILDASIRLIRAHGYDATTMDGIAAAAGVGKATVYRRWKTKEALVCEALERIMRGFAVPDTGSSRGDLRALMDEQRALYADPGTAGLLSALVAAMHRSKAIARVVRSGALAARQAAMVEVLRRGVARGDLPAGLDLDVALDLFNGPLFYRYLFTGKPIDDALAEGVLDALLGSAGRRRGGSRQKPAATRRRSSRR